MAPNVQMPALIDNQNYRKKKQEGSWVFSDMGDPATTQPPNKARVTNITANSPKKAPFFNWVRTTFAEKYVASRSFKVGQQRSFASEENVSKTCMTIQDRQK